ncbi:MAG: NAD(P)H-dependent oxidoreductase subunit E [Spirochaetia bacterium]|nr:NAD(P)H-dependent oxidoreductase subunit E [Spirochaetia bacterium]
MDNTNVSLVELHRDDILYLFHSMQNREITKNYITANERKEITQTLGLSIAEVDGVLSFYHLFSTSPRGRYVLRICDSLSCRIGNSLDVYGFISKELGIKRGETTKDGLFTLEIVNCLGSCDTAPNMMINDKLYSNLTLDEVDALIISCRKEETA